ncbi:MAG TPA: hypothetical protein D7I03_05595 [Candidatus Poseidoniales archaeon]|nr:MAG TPA: hypothetical protein D7I03_05595 [Candidatus Poseidoniales archaeon]HII50796.1 hypothetical protein [Candidatus Poseidoniaceae archaeon]|tara:strand:- start:1734 stop:1958 length:225 start_codon:yes stop_codon:yes gene_type:complete
MVESYRATIEWVGPATLGTVLLTAASRPGCSANLIETGEDVKLIIVVQKDSIQDLRDSVDELMVALSDIEENYQ